MRIEWLGEASLLVVVRDAADDAAAEEVRQLAEALRAKRLAGVTDIVPSYTTVGVHFDLAAMGMEGREKVRAWIEERAPVRGGGVKGRRRQVVIPVCYGGAFGPDLQELA